MTTLNMRGFEDALDAYVHKAPSIPYPTKQFLVKYGGYIALIIGILEIFNSGILSVLNLGIKPLWLNNEIFSGTYYLYLVFECLVGIMLILAFRPLNAKNVKGWRYALYASFLFFLVSLAGGDIRGIITTVVAIYLLFQVRPQYY